MEGLSPELELQQEEEKVPYRFDWVTTLAPPIDSNQTGNGSSNGTEGALPTYKFYQVRHIFLGEVYFVDYKVDYSTIFQKVL